MSRFGFSCPGLPLSGCPASYYTATISRPERQDCGRSQCSWKSLRSRVHSQYPARVWPPPGSLPDSPGGFLFLLRLPEHLTLSNHRLGGGLVAQPPTHARHLLRAGTYVSFSRVSWSRTLASHRSLARREAEAGRNGEE